MGRVQWGGMHCMGMRLNIDTAQGVAGVDCIGYKIQNTNVNTNMNTKCKIQNTKYKIQI